MATRAARQAERTANQALPGPDHDIDDEGNVVPVDDEGNAIECSRPIPEEHDANVTEPPAQRDETVSIANILFPQRANVPAPNLADQFRPGIGGLAGAIQAADRTEVSRSEFEFARLCGASIDLVDQVFQRHLLPVGDIYEKSPPTAHEIAAQLLRCYPNPVERVAVAVQALFHPWHVPEEFYQTESGYRRRPVDPPGEFYKELARRIGETFREGLDLDTLETLLEARRRYRAPVSLLAATAIQSWDTPLEESTALWLLPDVKAFLEVNQPFAEDAGIVLMNSMPVYPTIWLAINDMLHGPHLSPKGRDACAAWLSKTRPTTA